MRFLQMARLELVRQELQRQKEAPEGKDAKH